MNLERLPVLSLAPMAGITDWPLRVLCYRMGAEYACSEMVSAIGYLCAKPGNRVYTQLLQVHPEETNTACQPVRQRPGRHGRGRPRRSPSWAGSARWISTWAVPARKVVSIGEGSALLLNPDQAYKVMEAVVNHTTPARHLQDPAGLRPAIHERRGAGQGRPVAGPSVDVRPRPYPGAAVLRTGRLRRHRPGAEEQPPSPCSPTATCSPPETRRASCGRPAAPGLMIGRGAMGNPWLFRGAREALDGRPVTPVTARERIDVALLHLEWMVDYKGPRQGVLEMRKHLGHYVGGMRGATALRRELNMAKTEEELRGLLLPPLGRSPRSGRRSRMKNAIKRAAKAPGADPVPLPDGVRCPGQSGRAGHGQSAVPVDRG